MTTFYSGYCPKCGDHTESSTPGPVPCFLSSQCDGIVTLRPELDIKPAAQVRLSADELACKYVCNVTGLSDLVDRQEQHHYRPTIRLDMGDRMERMERAALAKHYNDAAAARGLSPCAH